MFRILIGLGFFLTSLGALGVGTEGDGAEFDVVLPGSVLGSVTVGIKKVSPKKITLEYQFAYPIAGKPRSPVQEIVFTRPGTGPWIITSTRIFSELLKKPEEVASKELNSVNDLGFALLVPRAENEDKSAFVAYEEMLLGKTLFKARHFQWSDLEVQEKRDAWFSPEAKPFGLVRTDNHTYLPDERMRLTYRRATSSIQFQIGQDVEPKMGTMGQRVFGMLPRRGAAF